MLIANLFERNLVADIAIQDKPHTALFQLFVAAHDDRLFQLETGNAIGHQPARAVIAVINRDLHALAAQHVRRGQTAGTGTDNSNAFTSLLRGRDRLDPAFFPRGVGDVFLDRADGHGAMARFLDHAIAFAQAVLRADAAANLGECIGGLADLVGLLQPPLGGQAQPVGNIVVQRAMRLAIRHTALRTAA